MKRTVFFVSDGTGITAETLGRSLLSQFESLEFNQISIPYVDTSAKATKLIEQINACDDPRPLVFSTLVNEQIRIQISACKGLMLDFFQSFLGPLESELKTESTHRVGRSHGMIDYESYKLRMDAVNYALSNDDGANIHNYEDADLILIGVSRCGKTPTCLYLALQFGMFVANYPFTEDDMQNPVLPDFLRTPRQKLFGLTIDPARLHAIRQERRPNSRYASLEQCQKEVRTIEALYQSEKIPYLSTTVRSIEEISTTILAITGTKRRLF